MDGDLHIPKKRTAALFLISVVLASYVNAAPIPQVRVLVDQHSIQKIHIQGFDLLVKEELSSKTHRLSGKTSLALQCASNGKMSLQAVTEKGLVRLNLADNAVVTSMGGFLRIGSTQFRDELMVRSINNNCLLINRVDLEKYVAGLLNSEMSSHWNLSTLKAQAVAARTYALYQMSIGKDPNYDVFSTVKDQVYEGAHQEHYKTLKAVLETKGQILSFNDRPIKAFYHSTCGGKTEDPEKVWGARFPYLKAVPCGFCNKSPRYTWQYTVDHRFLEEKLRHAGYLWGSLRSIRVIERNSVGRAHRIEVIGSKGHQVIPAIKLRDLIGTVSLKSTDFQIFDGKKQILFVGHGSGHGVGLCQYGAKSMGEEGYSYAEILSRYYPQAKLTKIY